MEPATTCGEWHVSTQGMERADSLILKVGTEIKRNHPDTGIQEGDYLYVRHRHKWNSFLEADDYPLYCTCSLIREDSLERLQSFREGEASASSFLNNSLGIFWLGYPEQNYSSFSFERI